MVAIEQEPKASLSVWFGARGPLTQTDELVRTRQAAAPRSLQGWVLQEIHPNQAMQMVDP